MSNRNFDSRVITTRLQNQNYARNLYKYNTSSQTLVHNAQTSDGTSSRNNTYREGAQTEYFRGLLGGGETVSIGGIVNIPPYPTSTVTSPPIPPTPPTIPSAPTINSIIPGNTVLTVNFTAGSNGGSAITNYEYSTDNGINWTSSGSIVSPIVISSLTNGSTYQVKLRAINSVGTGPASIAEPGTPAPTVPQAPEIDNVSPGDSQLIINFYPINDGGSPLTDIQYSLDDGSSWILSGVTNSPIIVTGLINGQQYSVRLQAINNIGTGPASDPAVEATPVTTPGAPTIDSINGYNNALVINFIPPVDSGGAPITTYWYSINNGTSYLDSDTTVSPIVIKSGVSNGTTYDIRILAVNSEGLGAPSSMVQGTPNPVIQTFTDPTQSYSFTPPYEGIVVQYLLVGGGGGSGGGYFPPLFGGGAGGGGGGGQVVTGTFTFNPGTYSVTVGDGGAGGDGTKLSSAANGGDGGTSSCSAGVQVALGGTGGLAWGNSPNDGSGGALNSGGSGSTGSAFGAGGGGGNSTAGNNKSGSSGGAGGAGTSSSISGSPITYGAGGNGANAPITSSTASPGADNTGNGASGGSGAGGVTVNGAKGGSGIVIFKY